MKKTASAPRSLAPRLALLVGVLFTCALPILLLAAPPAWWTDRGVLNGQAASDYAAANIGQLKNLATKTAAEMDARVAGGAGEEVISLVASWSASAGEGVRSDFAVLNLGQLKAVARSFYDRMIAAGYVSDYPWAGGTANDYAIANLGQLKNVFAALDPSADLDGDGLPAWWELRYALSPATADDPASDTDSDGLSLAGEYQAGTHPGNGDSDNDGRQDGPDLFPTDERRSESIPVRYYGAIDLTEGLANFPPVQQVALDDANQVAFAGWADLYSSESVRVAVWRDGTIVEDFGSPTSDFIPAFLNATGTLLGLMQAPEEPYAAYRVGLLTSAGVSTFGLPALYYYTVPGDPYNGQRIFLESVFLTGFSQAGEVFCDVSGILWEPRGGSFYGTAGNWQDDSLTVRAVSAQGVVAGRSGTGSGVRVNGATSDLAWLPGAASAPRSYAVNDQAQIVGLSGADDAAGYPLGFYSSVGTGGRTIQSFPDLLPAKYRKQLRSAIPYLITNADAATGQPTIVFGAESLEGDSSGDWITRTLALEWQAGVGGQPPQPVVRVLDVLRPRPVDGSPEPPTNFYPTQLNAQGLLAQATPTAPLTLAGRQIKAPLYSGVEFTTSDITKGFDYPLPNDPPAPQTVWNQNNGIQDEKNPEWWTSVGQGYLLGYGLNTRIHVNADVGSDPAAAWYGIRIKPEDTSLIELEPAELEGKETPLSIRGKLLPAGFPRVAQVEITDKASPPNVVCALKVACLQEWEIPVRICYVYDGSKGPDEPGQNSTRVYDLFRITDAIIDQLNETFGQACVQFY